MGETGLYLDLNHAFNSLFYRLSAIDERAYNRPCSDQWSAGQLAAHLSLSARNLLELVNGPAELRSYATDRKLAKIRGWMLGGRRNYPWPEKVLPGPGPFDPFLQTEELNQLQLGWLEATRLLNPAATCLLFRVPQLGLLTRREAGYFTLYHFQRHLYLPGGTG